ncbi:MAG: NADH:flavin oxidoreductase [Deltaproteobacteria bacterium]|nr:NADH:flavin oxidoreductase [Deltaproteobacteria bacterium]
MNTLDQPLVLRCGLTLPQRIAMAPLTNTQSEPDGSLGDAEFEWLVRRARDGFRWISTCAAFVSEQGHAWRGQLGIATDDHLKGLTRLATALREHGAAAVVQLHHGGAKAELAPGRPLSTVDGGPANTRAATLEDLDEVIEQFVAAAQRAERAGFSGVEIHGANGYLFTQFLAPHDNPREDEYGGDLAGRALLLRRTLRAVRAAVSPSFAVGVRVSPVDVWAQRGLVLDDGVQVGRWLVEDGADFIHLSLGDASGPPAHEPDAGAVARAFRDALPGDVPIFAAGGIWTREDAARAVGAGVDVVVVGRAAIAHPNWPVVYTQPEWEPKRPTWSPDYLRSVDVGEALLQYLSGFAGMVEGGAAPRG